MKCLSCNRRRAELFCKNCSMLYCLTCSDSMHSSNSDMRYHDIRPNDNIE